MLIRHKAIPILLAFTVIAAQVLCSCQSVMAGLLPSAKPTVHSCCEKHTSHSTPTDPTCPHCNGTAGITGAATVQDAGSPVSHDFVFLPLERPAMLLGAALSHDRPVAAELTHSPPASTLLELHSALLC